MVKPVRLFNLRLKPLYFAAGSYRSLFSIVRIKPGYKGVLEQTFLWLQSFGPKRGAQKPLLKQLESALGEKVKAVLLYDTSWYKETHWIGAVQTVSQNLFVKIYKNHADAIFNAQQVKFVHTFFSGAFILSRLQIAKDNILYLSVLQRKRNIAPNDFIESRLVQLNLDFINTHAVTKTANEIVPFDLYILLSNIEKPDLVLRLRSWLEKERKLTIIPVHGDMTPWNMFIDNDEKIVLLDYERAGWHVTFYDVFHFNLQQQALESKHVSLKKLMQRKPWFDRDEIREALVFYLIDQLCQHLRDYYINRYQHAEIRNLIDHKLRWLDEAMSHGEQ